jgi:Tol biopolymer transport system component
VAGDTNGSEDIFVHDRQTGQTVRVSVDSTGVEGNADSYDPSISSDGRYVVFDSLATNLVAGDTNDSYDVFMHDRQTGQTLRVSVDSTGVEGNGESRWPSISSDGRYVAFSSIATNLVAGRQARPYGSVLTQPVYRQTLIALGLPFHQMVAM